MMVAGPPVHVAPRIGSAAPQALTSSGRGVSSRPQYYTDIRVRASSSSLAKDYDEQLYTLPTGVLQVGSLPYLGGSPH